MIQHPIPQNVTGYQFRLIGDMTIKQFILLAIGIGAAIFFYYTNLFSFLKWPLMAISGMFGFAAAFLPIEERPLDQWLVNYIRAIYRPTQFIWSKGSLLPEYLSFTAANPTRINPSDAEEVARIAAVRKQQGLKSFLVTLPNDNSQKIDEYENTLARNFQELFYLNYSNPASSATSSSSRLGIHEDPASPATPTSPKADQVYSSGDSPASHSPKTIADPDVRSGVVPLGDIHVSRSREESINAAATSELTNLPTGDISTQSDLLTSSSTSSPVVAAHTTSTLPFPSAPNTPNTIVGMVLDSTGKIIDNAIIEVLDESGLPVRATKTNQLGQFFSTTPLKRGTYHLNIEKLGFTFDTIELSLTGQIVAPLKITAK